MGRGEIASKVQSWDLKARLSWGCSCLGLFLLGSQAQPRELRGQRIGGVSRTCPGIVPGAPGHTDACSMSILLRNAWGLSGPVWMQFPWQ